jgi:hypothetical protein
MKVKYVVWAAALAFAIGIALLLYALGGFGRLGSRTGFEKVTHAVVALGIGLASQAGLSLAPLARTRGPWPRAAATVLMIPALAFSFAAYSEVFRAPEQGGQPLDHPVVYLYLCIVPVHAVVAAWMWLAPPPHAPHERGP